MKEECNLLLTTLGEVELRVFGWILGKRKKVRSSCLALHGDHRAQIQTVLFIVNVLTEMLWLLDQGTECMCMHASAYS